MHRPEVDRSPALAVRARRGRSGLLAVVHDVHLRKTAAAQVHRREGAAACLQSLLEGLTDWAAGDPPTANKVDVKIGRSNYAADVCNDDMPKVEKALASIGITLKSALRLTLKALDLGFGPAEKSAFSKLQDDDPNLIPARVAVVLAAGTGVPSPSLAACSARNDW